MAEPRFEHLRRLTDSQGLLRIARGDVPDRFSGYCTLDNATALRLGAVGAATVEADVSHLLAKTYYGYLSRGRRYDSGVRHQCDGTGGWSNSVEDGWVQSHVARALACVIVSELPINLRLSAADWWRMLLEEHARPIYGPQVAANWLIAMGHLRAADPGRDLERAKTLSHLILEECYYPNRNDDWDWYAPAWSELAANVPTALWHAYHLLGERRIYRVAQAMTRFVTDKLFENDMLQPVGTLGGWPKDGVKAQYKQMPAEVCSIIELLCTAERISGNAVYGDYAEIAAGWFNGRNSRQAPMIDPATGGCYDALAADGPERNQGATATLACLLTHAALANRPVQVRDLIAPPSHSIEIIYSDPSIGS